MSEPRWRRYLRFWRRDPRADVDDELRFHFEERVAEFAAAGLSRSDALAAATARFGDVDATRAELVGIDERIGRHHDAWVWVDALRQDLRHTVRGLARQPGLVAGIGGAARFRAPRYAQTQQMSSACPPCHIVRRPSITRKS